MFQVGATKVENGTALVLLRISVPVSAHARTRAYLHTPELCTLSISSKEKAQTQTLTINEKGLSVDSNCLP